MKRSALAMRWVHLQRVELTAIAMYSHCYCFTSSRLPLLTQVRLVFSVNNSGVFFGYAVMRTPVGKYERGPAIIWCGVAAFSSQARSPLTLVRCGTGQTARRLATHLG
jgi:hypothetical protein